MAQERPKSSQERPKSGQEQPKSGQEHPKSANKKAKVTKINEKPISFEMWEAHEKQKAKINKM